MKFHNITKDDMLNGDGLRVVLWVSGCDHHCFHCQNPVTWDINDGILFDENAKTELFEELKKDYISGVTFSGGDPLHLQNREEVLSLAQEIKENFPQKTIWLYTGYLWEEVKDLTGIQHVDVLADGKFVEKLADPLIEWVGSSNQRVIDVPSSLQQRTVVLWKVTRKAFHSKTVEKE